MPYNNNNNFGIRDNPLKGLLYHSKNDEGLIEPGSPEFLVTQDGFYLVTQNGEYLVTEG